MRSNQELSFPRSETLLSEKQPESDLLKRWNRWNRNLFIRRTDSLTHGKITVHDEMGTYILGQKTDLCPLEVTVHIHDLQTYASIIHSGSIGVAEAYMRGEWTCSNLTYLVRIFVVNREVLDNMEQGFARFGVAIHEILHKFLNKNTKQGSKKNISAHYDLGNEFFRLFLDQTLMYSSAIFEDTEESLEKASKNKMDRICKKLELKPQDHLLEIGTGWGGFAIHAAQNYGCQVTTTTISQEQFQLAKERVKESGLQDRVEVLKEDYRNLNGQYDKLVSIEMIEAVGHQFLQGYFQKCSSLLKKDGMLLLQAITIDDRRYHQASKTVDFIQRYIFPGGCLPSISVMAEHLRESTDLCIYHLEDITQHYVTTLKRWREGFFANLDQVHAQGFSDEFVRMWEYYLCYCEGGFKERAIGTVHLMATKPLCKPRDLTCQI
ncbi:MAG: class I SAM-dependent methyltransferase [bacterium]|jgi:cyclopropane-fatty-acyl-phospholipid synthase